MQEQVIICPNCKKEIPLTEAISYQIKEELHREMEMEIKRKETEFREKEEKLSKREKEIKKMESEFEEKFRKKLEQERGNLEKKLRHKIEEEMTIEIEDLREEIKEKKEKLNEQKKKELELRKQQREIEEKQKNFELEMTRKVDEERKRIEEEVVKREAESHKFKDLEKDKQLQDLKRQIEELKRKAEQGLPQRRGEVLEIELEKILKEKFNNDDIKSVSPGKKGADVLQKVYEKDQYCGTIIWESKGATKWNDNWITKLKSDQRETKSEIAVLITTVLPKDIEISGFGYKNGVWITNFASAIGLATALRINLIQVSTTKIAMSGKEEKKEFLYNYVCSPQFSHRVEAIVENFVFMKNDLDKERRAMESIWEKREKQLYQAVINTAKMYGEMQGIIGESMPQIKSLELKALTEGTKIDKVSDDE